MNVPLFGFGAKPVSVSWGNKYLELRAGVSSDFIDDIPALLTITDLPQNGSTFAMDANPHIKTGKNDLLKTLQKFVQGRSSAFGGAQLAAGWTAYMGRIKSITGQSQMVFQVKCPAPPQKSNTKKTVYDVWRGWKYGEPPTLLNDYNSVNNQNYPPADPSWMKGNIMWYRGLGLNPLQNPARDQFYPDPMTFGTQADAQAWLDAWDANGPEDLSFGETNPYNSGIVQRQIDQNQDTARNFNVGVTTFKSKNHGVDQQTGFWQGFSSENSTDATVTITVDQKTQRISMSFEGDHWTGPHTIGSQ